MKPLDGARLKVVRAQEHLNSLKAEIGKYLDSRPYEFRAEIDRDYVSARSAKINVDPPLRLGCILGDCLSNLRTSLDFVAWQLVVKHSSVTPVVGKDRIYFPLSKDAASFRANGRSHLAHHRIPTAAIDIVERVQPYHAGYYTLGVLNRLVNEDKHCLPLLTVARAETASITIDIGGDPLTFSINHPPADFDPSEEFTIGFSRPGLTFDATKGVSIDIESVKVDGQVAVFISLQNAPVPREPVDLTLEKIVKTVADIIPRFDPFV